VFAASEWAQARYDRLPNPQAGISEQSTISGRVISDEPGIALGELVIQLTEFGQGGRVIEREALAASGEFAFNFVRPGLYTVQVVDLAGRLLAEETENASGGITRVELRLRNRREYASQGSVSVSELMHKPPKKARKEADQAANALKQNKLVDVIAHLRKAVDIDPAFITARRNLALVYLKVGDYVHATEAFHALLALDPRSILAHQGLSAAFMSLSRFADAESESRAVVAANPSDELGNYILGCALAAQDADRNEALIHLGKASRRFPMAHFISAQILARAGRNTEARERVRSYLDSGDDAARSEAETLLQQLSLAQ
jgi:tetratricopeptide (TPR) repeat protein